jgi:hypothetical protein
MGRHTSSTNETNPRNTNSYQPQHAAQETTPMDLPARSGVVFSPGAGQTAPQGGASAVRALINRARGRQ